jgi:hypothetical protein
MIYWRGSAWAEPSATVQAVGKSCTRFRIGPAMAEKSAQSVGAPNMARILRRIVVASDAGFAEAFSQPTTSRIGQDLDDAGGQFGNTPAVIGPELLGLEGVAMYGGKTRRTCVPRTRSSMEDINFFARDDWKAEFFDTHP